MGANARDGARWRSGDLSGDGGRTRRCSWTDTSEKISMRRSPENHFEKFGEDGEEANKNKNKAALPCPQGVARLPSALQPRSRQVVRSSMRANSTRHRNERHRVAAC